MLPRLKVHLQVGNNRRFVHKCMLSRARPHLSIEQQNVQYGSMFCFKRDSSRQDHTWSASPPLPEAHLAPVDLLLCPPSAPPPHFVPVWRRLSHLENPHAGRHRAVFGPCRGVASYASGRDAGIVARECPHGIECLPLSGLAAAGLRARPASQRRWGDQSRLCCGYGEEIAGGVSKGGGSKGVGGEQGADEKFNDAESIGRNRLTPPFPLSPRLWQGIRLLFLFGLRSFCGDSF